MSAQFLSTFVQWLAAAAATAVVFFWVLSFLYRRSSKEAAFVRTGFGGEKVVVSGGALVIPVIHEVTPVGMSSARIAIDCVKEQAAITKDRLRVDAMAEFHLAVLPDPEMVSIAAAALGEKTMQPTALAEHFSGQLRAALRATIAESSLDDLQDSRADFAGRVKLNAIAELKASGVGLASIAIIDIDQSDLTHFNSSNRFDAEGLTKLVETIEERRKLRNDIEQQAMVDIRRRNLQAEQETLALEEESAAARLNQERAVEAQRAQSAAAIEQEKAQRQAEAAAARVAAEQRTAQERIAREQETQAAEVAARQQVEQARIAAETELDERRVARERALRLLEIERAEQVRQRELAKEASVLAASTSMHEAAAAADVARAAAAAAAEGVAGAQEVARSEQRARVREVEAASEAQTATQLAEARRIRAAAEAEADRILNEAENILTEDARTARLKAKLINKLEDVIRESLKPLEKIDGFKVVHIGGGGGNASSPLDEVIQSAMRYRVQAPLLDEVLKDIGLEGGKLTSSTDIVRAARDMQSLAKETKAGKDDGK